MPEIAEIHRVVHYLKKHVVGRTISAVKAETDEIVYGKVGCSAQEFQKQMTGKKVLDARQQGKYFWLVMDSPPHPLMHFGMTGWIKFSNDDNASYYKPAKGEERVWPPRFMKFVLTLNGDPDCEVAFVDPRRLARIRLVDVEAEDMRKTSPLKENGPDPVIDKDLLTKEWLAKKLGSKKVPVKALLLDQGNISGVGNWVADEVLYQARIHPEQYSNTFNDDQIARLHDSLIGVCTLACEVLAESSRFPDTWLMKHRWNKGKKNANVLPNGDKIIHLKVGGRTSAVVPNVQKKTGPVAGDVSAVDLGSDGEDEDEKPKAKPKSNGNKKTTHANRAKKDAPARKAKKPIKEESDAQSGTEDEDDDEAEVLPSKKRKSNGVKAEITEKAAKRARTEEKVTIDSGRRRSGRTTK